MMFPLNLILTIFIVLGNFLCSSTPSVLSSSSRVYIQGGKIFGRKDSPLMTWANKKLTKQAEIGWLSQPVDHDKPNNHPQWQQRYAFNLTKHSVGGPILIMVGGESPLDPRWLAFGQMVEHALILRAEAMFLLEHRFYGESWPLGDASIASLKYLTVSQALGDLKRFILHIKDTYKFQDNKIILYGGSYAGTLVAYFMERYPSLAQASLASSAPITFRLDYSGYVDLTSKAIKAASPKCLESLGGGVRELNSRIKKATDNCNGNPCPVDLSPLKLCGTLDAKDTRNVNYLNSFIFNFLIYIAQYNNSLPTGFNLNSMCKAVLKHKEEGGGDFGALAKILEVGVPYFYETDCINFNFHGPYGFCNFLSDQSKEGEASKGSSRQWIWQVCNEIASFPSTSGSNHPFGYEALPLQYNIDMCNCGFQDKFPITVVHKNVLTLRQTYGGLEKYRPFVIFTNGELDPVTGLSYSSGNQLPLGGDKFISKGENNALFIIKGGSHCVDIGPSIPSRDSPSLISVRNETLKRIQRWIVKS